MKHTTFAALLSHIAALASAQTFSVRAVDLDPAIVSSLATDITPGGRVVGLQTIEKGRRTLSFVWRDGAIEQLVVPQPGDFSIRPRRVEIHHHVQVLAMTEGGIFGGVASNVGFGHNEQPFFSWIPTADPYPDQFLAADDVGSAWVHDLVDTSPFITGVGSGLVQNGSTFVRKGWVSRISMADDVGDPPRVTVINGFGSAALASAALAVNIDGTSVGFAENSSRFRRGFKRDDAGTMTELGTLGGPSSRAHDISDAGHIVGQADIAPGQPHAFGLQPRGTFIQDLGTLGGDSSSAWGVNNHGHVVGESWTADGLVHAFLVDDRGMVDLNTLIPPDSGWVLTHAEAINDDGMIVGWGQFQGRTLAFVLSPAGCPADLTGASDPNDPTYGIPDGALDISDFFYFLDQFVAGNLAAADLTTTSDPNDPGYGVPDGALDGSDFFFYLDLFVAGCP